MFENVEKFRGIGSARELSGKQSVLFMFVGDPNSAWTPELRIPIEKSISSCLGWLKSQAESYGVSLDLRHGCIPEWRILKLPPSILRVKRHAVG
jgi:hypothetical protein